MPRVVKVLMIGSSVVLAASLVAMLALYAVTAIGRANGVEEWGSLNGPAPVWPAVVGFGSMWAAVLSLAALLLLTVISVIHALVRRRPDASEPRSRP